MISGVSNVVVQVQDQDRAKAFWTKTMGFQLVQDAPYEQERWLEVSPPTRLWGAGGGEPAADGRRPGPP
jgi:catechol 2,3-dioxygenase-like lactoylglutathione lyase family enzyme